MKQNNNIQVEAEGGELIIRNGNSDYVIVPKKYRLEVQDMIKENCHGCIDKLVETLPIMEDYAEDGSIIPNDKKNNFKYKPYTVVQDNTYVAPKVVMPLELKKKQQFVSREQPSIRTQIAESFQKPLRWIANPFEGVGDIVSAPEFVPREQPVLKADTRTNQERKIAQEYRESVLNPSIRTQIGEGFQKLLRWPAGPVKGVGDIVSAIAPNSALAKDLPNTNAETYEYRKKQLNPYISNKEKINNTINEARDLTINSLINAGTMELGFAIPRSFVSPAMTNMFGTGSKANFLADLLQLSKTDFDKLGDGDLNEIANVLLNGASTLSKMNNFDASTIYNNIKNWKSLNNASKSPLNNIINNNGVYTINGVSGVSFNNMQKAVKYLKEFKNDTYKDIFNLSQSINQQTQRNEK